MKNKILSFVGSRLEGRKGNTQRTSNLSPTNHQRYHRTWGAIFTLVMLFTFAIGNVWGAINNTTVTKAGGSQKYIDVTTTAASNGDEVTVEKQYIAYTISELTSSAIKGVWYTQSSSGSGSSNSDAVAITGYRTACNKYIPISSSKKYTHYVTNCVSFSALYDPRGPSRYCTITATNVDDAEDVLTITNSGTVASGTKYNVELTGLSASKYYRVVVETDNSSESRIYQIRLGALVNSDGPFAVTYDKNNEGASGTMTDANSPYAKNTSVAVLGNSFTAPTGMVFAGWNTKANGSGTSYAAGDSFSATEDVTLYAQWAYPETGTGTITYALTSNKNEVTPTVSGVSTLSSSSTAFALSTLTCGSGNEKSSYSGQIQGHAEAYSASQYVALQFTVADGYTFTPSSLSFVTWVRSSNVMKTKVVISDGITSIESNELTSTADTDCPITFAADAFTGKKLTGNVSITMYQWGATGKRSYVKSSVTITGTVAAATPSCEDPETALSLSSNANATVYVDDVITFSTTGGNGGTVTIAGANSETISENKWTATEGEHTFTASQAKNGNYCAQEDVLVLTVNQKTPVTSAVISSDAADKDHVVKGSTVNLTCTAANATTWQWYLGDDPISGATSSTYSVTANTVGTFAYKVAAYNSFNTDPVVSSAYSITVEQNYDISGLKGNILVPTAVLNLPNVSSTGWSTNITTPYFQNSNVLTFSIYGLYQSFSNQTWGKTTKGGSTSGTWEANGVFAGSAAYHAATSVKDATTEKVATSLWDPSNTDKQRIYSFRVKNATEASVRINASSRKVYFEAYEIEAEATTLGDLVEQQTNSESAVRTLTLTLNKDKEYVLAVYGSQTSNSLLYELALTFPQVAVTGVTLNKSSLTLPNLSASEQLTATVAPATATNKNVTWSIAPTGIATVTDGLVEAVAAGDATVTVTTQDGKFTATCNVTVEAGLSSDATLSDLTVGGETVDGFAAATEEYDVVLPFGTTAVPAVAGTANDANAKSVVVAAATSLPGATTVVVTAEDNSTKTYTVNFTVEESKDIEMVWKTSGTRCGGTTTGSTAIKSNNAAVSTYINQITFTNVEGSGDDGAEGSSSLNVGKKAGNMLTLSAKPGYAMQAMSFYGKIESADTKLEYSLDGGSTWNDLASTSSDDACYSNVFAAEEVHTLCMRSVGNKGFWIRNMQLTMIQACTPKTIAWTAAPASEYEVGATVDPIAASANNGNVTYAASNAAITVAANGALTINSLTNDVDITASVAGGNGTTYCAAGASVAKEDIKTYYLVKFNAQNETDAIEVKYYSGDAAIALPATPSYPGYVFQGWFDAAEGGNAVTGAITPEASRTVYAQWEAQCVGPTITTQPVGANYFVDRTASALSCEATPGVTGKTLTYTWYSCDDTERTNPVALAGAPTPSTAAVGTFYYYCAVTEEDCDVIRNSNVVTINVTEKEMLLLIQANHVKGKTATISGYIGGTYRKEMQDNSKLGSKGYYFGIKLASGTFQAGDRVYIHTAAGADTNGDKVRIFKSNEASAENVLVEGTEAMVSPNGDNWVTLPETTLDSLYLRRGTDTENYNKDWNPYIDIFAVYRPYPVPVLTAMTVNGSDAAITGTNVAATIASNAELASLTIVPTFMSNDPENTNGALGDWTEVSEGVYTASYVVTDKDGDTNTYTITLTRDVEIASVTISGETTVAEESQITLTATVLPDNVANKAVVWSSSDETKAVVDANGVVTGKAAGAVTITATAVADNTKFGTYDITVTGFIGTKRAYWFAYADDAAANGVTNNSAVFGGAPTGSNSGAKAITLEEGWTVNTTKKAGAPGSTGTFVVPAEYTATFYAVVKGSGSSGRYLKLKQGDNVKYTSEEFGSTDPTVLKIEGVVAGTYTIVYEGGMSNFYLYAAELNRYAISSVTLESGFTLRTENKRTPEMTLVHAKAAIASQTWSIVSSTATGTTINASTGEITAGTTPGTITVQVVVEDVMGNEVTSNICTVEIVEMFERLDVTGDITWNWNAAANEENVYVSTANGLALANYIAGDDWKYISGTNNDWAYNTNNEGSYQGVGALSFYTTVPGILKISGKRISNNAVITINGTINAGTLDGNVKTLKAVYVPAGEVTIAPDEAGMRITKIEFKATADYSRPNLNPNNIGTLCWTNNAILGGATLYKLTGKNENNYLVFDEVEENRLEAGKPYIFVPENGNTEIKVYNTDNATALEQDDLQAVNGMMGTFVNLSTLPVAEGGQGEGSLLWNKYIISNNHYVYVDYTNCRLGAYRAYITSLDDVAPANQEPAPTQNGAPRRRLVMGGNAPAVATDVDNIYGNDTKVQKVLINGQLFIIRGDKTYDATGRFVK